jgi:hypothetical protein
MRTGSRSWIQTPQLSATANVTDYVYFHVVEVSTHQPLLYLPCMHFLHDPGEGDEVRQCTRRIASRLEE